MATAQTADFFGGGTLAAPNVQAPNQLTPQQIADIQRNANVAKIQQAAQSTALNNAAFVRQSAPLTGGTGTAAGKIVSNQGLSSKAPVILPGTTSNANGQYQTSSSGGTAVYTDNAGNLVHQDGTALTAAEYDQYQQVTKTGKYANSLGTNLIHDPATLAVLAAPYAVLGGGLAAGGAAALGFGEPAAATSAGAAGSAALAAPYAAGGAYGAPLLADTGIGAASGSAAAAGGAGAAGAAGAGAAGTAAGTAAGGAAGSAAGGLAKGIIGGIAGAAGAGLLAGGIASQPGAVQPAPLPPIPDSVQQGIANTQSQGQSYAATQQAAAQRAQQVAASIGQNTPDYASQGQSYANRAAPQITGDTGQGAQNAALAAAAGFQPNTSGIAAIQNARADTSGAAALQNFQGTAAQQGVDALRQFAPTEALQGAANLQGLDATATRNAAAGIAATQQTNAGIGALNNYANAPEGPSAAQALLQSGSDANIRQALALARSARGGPAAVAQAQRVAQSENAATQAQTSGQAAALRAQETNDYLTRQLSALQASGQLISNDEALNLQAKVASGQLISAADAQKLSAYQSAAQSLTAAGAQRLGASTAAGQLQSAQDAQRLSAQESAANVLLQGSQINQQGAIAASNAQLTASGQQLQAISLQGQISDQIRTANIDVLKANQSAALQQLNLNDTQVRAFAQIGEDARQANQTASLNAAQLGINASAATSAVDLAWQQFAQSQLTSAQQLQVQQQGLAQGLLISNNQQQTQQSGQLLGAGGALLTAAGQAISDERAKKGFKHVAGKTMAKALRDSPASEWEYKEPDKPGRASGRQVGPMAQGLQKSPVFRGAVQQTKDGTLAVDSTRLVLAHHGALSHLQKEIDLIKKHRKAQRAHG